MGSSTGSMGKGPKSSAAREEVGNMGPGKVSRKMAATRYTEGGSESYSPKGMSKRKTSEE